MYLLAQLNNYTNSFPEPDILMEDEASTFIFAGMMLFIIFIAFLVLISVAIVTIAQWKILSKAGRPGWAAIVPFYGQWLLLELVGFPGWLSVLVLIPYLGQMLPLALTIMIGIKLPEKFGKEQAFSIGLILLPVVFYPILGFSKAEYIGDETVAEKVVVEETTIVSETEEE